MRPLGKFSERNDDSLWIGDQTKPYDVGRFEFSVHSELRDGTHIVMTDTWFSVPSSWGDGPDTVWCAYVTKSRLYCWVNNSGVLWDEDRKHLWIIPGYH